MAGTDNTLQAIDNNKHLTIGTQFKPIFDMSIVGRPLKYIGSKEEITELIKDVADYIENSLTNNQVLTINGLSLHIGFCSRKQFIQYENDERIAVEFRNVIKKARSMVENQVEGLCLTEGKAGQIFWLKNHGWIDEKSDTNVNVNVDFGSVLRSVLNAEQKADKSIVIDIKPEPKCLNNENDENELKNE